jgi:hypothetical protein
VKRERNKREERIVGKAAGDESSLYRRRAGLADEASSDAMPDAAGGEGSHGAARPDRVIHKNIFNRPHVRRQTPSAALVSASSRKALGLTTLTAMTSFH